MKKAFCLLLAILLVISITVGCKSTTSQGETQPSSTSDSSSSKNTETKLDESDDSYENNISSDIYAIVVGGTGDDNISYHFVDCKKLNGKKYEEISIEAIQMIGLRQCNKCKPPKYEGYID